MDGFAGKISAAITGTCTVAGTALAYLQWAGVEFDGFISAATNYLPLWFPPTAFTFGICIGWYARGRSQGVSRSERKYLERCEQERLEEDFEKAKASFYALDANIKALMLAALDKGGAYCNGTDWRFSGYSDAPFITQFVATRYIDGDIAKITATPLLEHFRERVPDLFDGVKSTLESHARKKGTRVASSFSTSLNWWWHR